MFDYVIVIALLYFAYSNSKPLFEIPLNQWEGVQYLLALVNVLLLLLAVYRAWMIYKKKKKTDAEAAEKKAIEDAEAAARKSQEDAVDDLAYLDEMDAEEDAAARPRHSDLDEIEDVEYTEVPDDAEDSEEIPSSIPEPEDTPGEEHKDEK